MTAEKKDNLYGLMAEFETPERLTEAARRVRERGYTRTDAYTPFPVEGLAEALGMTGTRVPLVTLICGILGGLAAFGFMTWTTVFDYPWNIGGRPHFSWPAFIPVTFEITVLSAAMGALISMLVGNRLLTYYHPLFNVKRFEAAGRDGFFLCIEAEDERFDPEETRRFLETLQPVDVMEVPY
jgi:hypothetical protein